MTMPPEPERALAALAAALAGPDAPLTAAVIGGVFNPANLETARAEGLAIVRSHRLQDLADFIESTRGQPARPASES